MKPLKKQTGLRRSEEAMPATHGMVNHETHGTTRKRMGAVTPLCERASEKRGQLRKARKARMERRISESRMGKIRSLNFRVVPCVPWLLFARDLLAGVIEKNRMLIRCVTRDCFLLPFSDHQLYLHAVKQEHFEILLEEMRGHFQVALEGQSALSQKMDAFDERHAQRSDHLEALIRTSHLDLSGQINKLDGRLDPIETKLDVVARSLEEHRADTEAHAKIS
ncbi:MAG: hypothetical protein V2A34_06710 [Lentisphaerota bacterium]